MTRCQNITIIEREWGHSDLGVAKLAKLFSGEIPGIMFSWDMKNYSEKGQRSLDSFRVWHRLLCGQGFAPGYFVLQCLAHASWRFRFDPQLSMYVNWNLTGSCWWLPKLNRQPRTQDHAHVFPSTISRVACLDGMSQEVSNNSRTSKSPRVYVSVLYQIQT